MKLLVLLFTIFASPSPSDAPHPSYDNAAACYQFPDGMDCQEAWADSAHEVCWCAKVDNEWVFCGCMEPRNMSKAEWLEYLVYRGKDSEVQI